MDSETVHSGGDTHVALSATELEVAGLWCEVLGIPELPGATDDFFSLGGDSMAMVLLEHRIKERFSLELPAGTLLGTPTLRELASLIDVTREISSQETLRR